MLEEGDTLSVRGNAWMTDPTRGFVDYLADREFKAILAAHVAHDGQLFSIRRPVSPLYAVENVARTTSVDWHAGQRTRLGIGTGDGHVGKQSNISGGRNAHQLFTVAFQ